MRAARAARKIVDMGTIVVATDGSEAASAALAEAVALARHTGDDIAAITVWQALQGDFGLAFPATALLDELLDAERNHAIATLERALDHGREHGVAVRTRLATGDPAEQICAFAEEVGARLVAVGTHGYGTVATLLLGSVSGAVIRKAPCPVLVVRAAEQAQERPRKGRAAAAGRAAG